MNNHPIYKIKLAAKRILAEQYYRCVFATLLCSVLAGMAFEYILNGSLKLNEAIDYNTFSKKLLEFKTYDEMHNYITSQINVYIATYGAEHFRLMIHKLIIALVITFVLRLVYRLMVIRPLEVGSCRFYMDAHSTTPSYKVLLRGFDTNYLNIIKILLIRYVKIILYSLLFIIPGIIKAYETFMIPYILADNPNIDSKDAFKMSADMMEGNKMNVFMLNLSFIGWFFLCAVTTGLALVFYVGPYYNIALSNMALRIKTSSYYLNEATSSNKEIY